MSAIWFRNSLLVVFVAIAAELTIHAQVVSATLTGTITDSSGAVVPKASVTAIEVRTGVEQTTISTGGGVYSIPFLTPGSYTVEVNASGFKKFSRTGVDITIGANVRVDITLTLGDVNQRVQVTAESPLLQTDRAEVAQTFETKEATDLPLANRNVEGVAALLPGTAPPTVDVTALEDPESTTFYNANGQSTSSNRTIVDGVNQTDNSTGSAYSIYIPQMEDVEEVHVTTSNYNAEFGHVGGAVVNVATRGGTNTFHGTLWEFNRNTDLIARDFFNPAPLPKPTFLRNEFGASSGGPIKKNKTFFFGGYQGRHISQSSVTITTVPVAPWRTGDFSAVPGLNLFDPSTGNPDGTGRLPFPDQIIPATRIVQASAGLVPLIPLPNEPGYVNNLNVSVPTTYNANTYDGRIDQNFSDRAKFFLKYGFSKYNVESFSALGNVVGNGSISHDYTTFGSLNFSYGLSPTLFTEARFGYSRYLLNANGIDINGLLPGVTSLNQQLGIANPNPDWISSEGLAAIAISGGMEQMGAVTSYPKIKADNEFTFVNTWSKIFGTHSFKWGGQILRGRYDKIGPQGLNLGPRGLFNFDSGETALNGGPALGSYGSFGNPFAAFLIGAPDEIGRTYETQEPTVRQTEYSGFFQDTWQVAKSVTLDLGIRYDLFTPVTPHFPGGSSDYDSANNSLLVAGMGGVSMSDNIKADTANFGPRFGIAWRLNNKSVLRAGYGISYWTGDAGFSGGTLETQYPVIYNIQEGSTGVYTVAGPFNSLPPFSFVTVPSSGIINPAPNQAFYEIPRQNLTPYVDSYNLTYERDLGWGIVMDVGYVGNLGRRLPYNLQLNTAPPGAGTAGEELNALFGRTATTTLRANGVNSNYNSLQTSAMKRFSQGLTFLVAYTWSKSMDVGSNQASFDDNLDIQRNYGPSSFDRTQMLTISHLYVLPFGKGEPYLKTGLPAIMFGGWQLNGIFRADSGMPFSVIGNTGPCNCPGNTPYANVVRSASIIGSVNEWFDITAFSAPSPNTFGNAGRDSLRGPRLINYDSSIFRIFPITEQVKLTFRSEFYNITNTPHFANPASTVGNSGFGQITSSLSGYSARQIQFALRLAF
jgi:hypothetical protein